MKYDTNTKRRCCDSDREDNETESTSEDLRSSSMEKRDQAMQVDFENAHKALDLSERSAGEKIGLSEDVDSLCWL